MAKSPKVHNPTKIADQRKLDPKLRMVANCSTEVNTVRAEFSAALKVTDAAAAKQDVVRQDDDPSIEPARREFVPVLKQISSDVMVNVFVQLKSQRNTTADLMPMVRKHADVRLQRGTQATATVKLSDLPQLAKQAGVTFVEMGDMLTAPVPITGDTSAKEPKPRVPRGKNIDGKHRDGEGVLIGIIDVQGFDFAHSDFLDGKRTRFERIWDQGGTTRPSPKKPFDYGSEISKQNMDAAIKAASKVGAPPTDLEPQSQMDSGSHGTHVASIAAGNFGVCPKAKLAGVLISLTKADQDRRKSFYDSTRLVDAVEYLIALAKELGKRGEPLPLSINISLGTNGHAHDGSAACCRWIDAALTVPGRCVTVAAGNAGQEVSMFPGDLGYFMGRIHTKGNVAARDLVTDIDIEVIGNGRADISENELEIWYSPQDRFEVSLRPPGGDWIGPIGPREYLENHRIAQSHFVSIYNELYHPANGANYIAIYLSPFFDPTYVIGVESGIWTVRLHGQEIRSGAYHGWIERDDPRPAGRVGSVVDAWHFPSCFSERSNVDNTSISTLACAHNTVAVANFDEARELIHVTSSQGPTRDDRSKPDVAAPGTDILAAKGFAGSSNEWIEMTGTSMASPYVTGVAGLMLAAEPRLTASQIVGIVQRTARPLPGRSFPWTNDGGFGCIDAVECIREAVHVNERVQIQKKQKTKQKIRKQPRKTKRGQQQP